MNTADHSTSISFCLGRCFRGGKGELLSFRCVAALLFVLSCGCVEPALAESSDMRPEHMNSRQVLNTERGDDLSKGHIGPLQVEQRVVEAGMERVAGDKESTMAKQPDGDEQDNKSGDGWYKYFKFHLWYPVFIALAFMFAETPTFGLTGAKRQVKALVRMI